MKYILALDQGTTSSRAIVFDHAGNPQAVAQKEFTQIFPQPGWVEHDPNEIWACQLEVALEAVQKAGLTSADIAGIGITNQRETTVIWDRKTGQPIDNAIVWQDRRTSEFCDQLKADGHVGLFQERTGLVLDAYFSGTKIRWLLNHVEGAREKADAGALAFGTIDSWLVWKLTRGHVHLTDVTNAARTLLFNINTGQWDDELLKILDVPRAMLPEVRPSSDLYARTRIDEFDHPIPIAGIAGDQHAALFGQACTQAGMVKNTYGTGCFILMNTGNQPVASKNNLLTTVAWQIEDRCQYALEGSVFMGGTIVQWLRDGLGIIKASSEIEALASSVESTDGVYLVPALTGLGAPHWDPYARGTILGLSRGSTGAHLARAALEGIAYQSADVVGAMVADAGIQLAQLRVDGVAAANDLLMQFQADLLNTCVVRPKVLETTALGAAYLAGLAVGYWTGQDEISGQWQVEKTFEPQISADQARSLQAGWQRALERAKDWASGN